MITFYYTGETEAGAKISHCKNYFSSFCLSNNKRGVDFETYHVVSMPMASLSRAYQGDEMNFLHFFSVFQRPLKRKVDVPHRPSSFLFYLFGVWTFLLRVLMGQSHGLYHLRWKMMLKCKITVVTKASWLVIVKFKWLAISDNKFTYLRVNIALICVQSFLMASC